MVTPHTTTRISTVGGVVNSSNRCALYQAVTASLTSIETVKTADFFGYVRLYGYRPKSLDASLGCGFGALLRLCL